MGGSKATIRIQPQCSPANQTASVKAMRLIVAYTFVPNILSTLKALVIHIVDLVTFICGILGIRLIILLKYCYPL